MVKIYIPDTDSFLLASSLKKQIPELFKKNPELKFLEIGCGSGFQLETLKKIGVKKKNIFGVDINKAAVNLCLKKGFNCIESDLFKNVKEKFDIIIFNPPYLPEDSREPKDSKLSTTGGKKGSEIINNFLSQAKNYLKKNGKIFLVTSSLTKAINWNNFKKKKIVSEKMFFEEIYVWKLRE